MSEQANMAAARYEREIPEGYEARIEGNKVIFERKESEDERLRRLLVWQVHRIIEDETNDLAGSVYDGIKGHDPDLEESIEDWKKCLAYLEKQKEQQPAEWSLTEFMAEAGRYEVVKNQIERERNWLKSLQERFNFQPKIEWSKEDKRCFDEAIEALESLGFDGETSNLKSLRDNYKKCNSRWKPSEEQMAALLNAEGLVRANNYPENAKILASLYTDLKKL